EDGYSGRHVVVDGKELLNFGSCSYLGLDQREELKEGVIEATRRYGTQFSYSRTYMQSPLYERLEHALSAMTGAHALVTPTTTLGHVATLPVIIQKGDAVLVDAAVHASVQTAAQLVPAPLTEIKHGSSHLESEIARLASTHKRVHYLVDGLYSMHGDFAPFAQLAELLARHPKLHLYVDDAHSTSWTGKNGRGTALEVLPDLERVVVALSLNKAFSAAGGAIIFQDETMHRVVRNSGGPMVFSGPVQPPMLGAALASATLHLDPEFAALQEALLARIRLVRELATKHGIRFASDDIAPIFFVPCGQLTAMFILARRLHDKGLYMSPSGFPAVPRNKSGIRFTISLHNTEDDIRTMMTSLSEALDELGVTQARIT
ncbi:MAG TPA: aminotransferase class I/II-fold pyridoxal phosphate-dependent enzyme, partial [Polyangiaceae bacterium]